MSNRSGFPYAQLDSAFLSDAKFRRLVRLLPEPRDFYGAVGIYAVMIAAAWRTAARETTTDEECEDAPAPLLEALRTAKLLTSEGRIPEPTFEKWVGEQIERRRQDADRKRIPKDSGGVQRKGAESNEPTSSTYSANAPSATGGAGGLEQREAELFAFLAKQGAFLRPESSLGLRLVQLIDRRGIEVVWDQAQRLSTGARMSDRQWVFSLEGLLERAVTPAEVREDEVHNEARRRSVRVQEQMHARRLEHYRFTGKWDEAWGPVPEVVS